MTAPGLYGGPVLVASVLSLKGGVGKTTVTLGLASAAVHRGCRHPAGRSRSADERHHHGRSGVRRTARRRPPLVRRRGAGRSVPQGDRQGRAGLGLGRVAAAAAGQRAHREPQPPGSGFQDAVPAGERAGEGQPAAGTGAGRLPAVARSADPQRADRGRPGRAGHRAVAVRRHRGATGAGGGADRAARPPTRPAAARRGDQPVPARGSPNTSTGSPSCETCSGRWCSRRCCPIGRRCSRPRAPGCPSISGRPRAPARWRRASTPCWTG